ncbi:glycosyltransferase [Flavobacterium sp.]|jgi:glycosyltransferase involved in cell wall biosynthesis|uniref:glycosyltransferase n=1 Tax=Flavobacterium sp. TaxID=239 RepID=UPI0037BEFA12
MRVLQIINSLGTGGAEKLLLDTIPIYRKRGIQMDVLLFWDNNHEFTKALKELKCCKVIVLNESLNYKDIYSISNVFKLKDYLKDYEVAHVHLFPAQYYTVLANLMNGNICKLIFTEHSTSNRRIRNNFFRLLDKVFYKGYHKIVCITKEVLHVLLNHTQFNSNRFIIIKNGVDVSRIFDSKKLSINEIDRQHKIGDKYVIQVSSFHEPKDHWTLLQSLKFLPTNIKLVMVGVGNLQNDVREKAIREGFNDRVFFLGQRMDVPQLLKTADIVVLSSKYEGLSLSSIEGMASGNPFIASDVPGLSEIAGGAGVLFEFGKADELAFKINELLTNPDLYQKVAQACQERAKQYDIKQMIDKHIELYKSVYEN